MFSVSGMRLCCAAASVVLAIGAATAASAATFNVLSFAGSDVVSAQGALASFRAGTDGSVAPGHVRTSVTEGFEGHQAWNGVSGTSNPSGTAVGNFSSLGGTGTGATAVNGGTDLQVRSNNPWDWGRTNTSEGGNNWLDSNDTYGIKWEVAGLPKFNAIAFLLTDVADVGAKFSLEVGGSAFSSIIGTSGRLANGTIHLVTILLPDAVDSLTLRLRNDKLNDGFGIDAATVSYITPSSVPVPPAAFLLVSGIAAMSAVRRRRRRAAA